MTAVRFPLQLIRPTTGRISYFGPDVPPPRTGTWSVTIPIEPFSADDEYSHDWRAGTEGPHVISTEVRLDFIDMPAVDLVGLANRRFRFPINPVEGYIDGSIYLCGSHNGVLVTAIQFGSAVGDSISANFVATFDFQFELWDVLNFDLSFAADLIFSPP
jgi:hypothetical protein